MVAARQLVVVVVLLSLSLPWVYAIPRQKCSTANLPSVERDVLDAAHVACEDDFGVTCVDVDGTCHVVAMEVPLYLSNTSLRLVYFEYLQSVQSAIRIQDNPSLVNVSFPALEQQYGLFYLTDNPILTDLELPSLTRAGQLRLLHLDALESVSIPLCAELDHLSVTSNKALTRLALPALRSLGGAAYIADNAVLSSVDLSHLRDLCTDPLLSDDNSIALQNSTATQYSICLAQLKPGLCISPAAPPNVTATCPGGRASIGFIGAAVAVLCFGTYAVPVKLSPVADGVFFQWVACAAILLVGLVAQLASQATTIYPIALVGGMLWCIGNVTVVPIIGLIGLGLGLLLWGLVNMLVGWFIGTFGIFIAAETVAKPILNYVGIAVAAVSFFLYFFVKTELPKDGEHSSGMETTQQLDASLNWEQEDLLRLEAAQAEAKKKAPQGGARDKILGALLSVFAGVCYGFNMMPVTRLTQQNPDAGQLDFALSHFLGIFLTSTAILVVYSIAKRNRPFVDSRTILGGLVAGTLWGVAQCAWFIANANLSVPVAFPIVATGPGIIGSLWALLYFKEIRGGANIAKLCGAFALTLVGILLIAFSK